MEESILIEEAHIKKHMETFDMIEKSIKKLDDFKKRIGATCAVTSADVLRHMEACKKQTKKYLGL